MVRIHRERLADAIGVVLAAAGFVNMLLTAMFWEDGFAYSVAMMIIIVVILASIPEWILRRMMIDEGY